MKKFILKILFFVCLLLLAFFLCISFADGTTDSSYLKFTSPKQKSFILGTSRAAQGLQPKIFDSILNTSLYNFAFTIEQSPYGPTYLHSIQKKLDFNTKDGIFILSVDPWSISSKTENPNDSIHFRELTLCLGNTSNMNQHPNYEYLLKNLQGQFYTIFTNKFFYNVLGKDKPKAFLHEDGWLELFVPMDSVELNKRVTHQIEDYKNNILPQFQFSNLRLNYLKQTIQFLKKHGKVYLVRLPVHPKMMALDQKLIPDFNTKMNSLVPLADAYLDLTSTTADCTFIDGNHLYKTSGKEISKNIAEWIKSQNTH